MTSHGSDPVRLGHFVTEGGGCAVFAEVDGTRYRLAEHLDRDGTVDALIASWEESEGDVRAAIRSASDAGDVVAADVELRAPVLAPSKILLIGANYRDHCEEAKLRVPEEPLILSKPPTALSGSGGQIIWDPAETQQVDLEVELAVVIGKTAKGVTKAEAADAIFGYTVGNDVSARDLQVKDRQWVRAKSLDTFCPLGPVVVRDDALDPGSLDVRSSINGRSMQRSNTSNMIFDVHAIVSFISRFVRLDPGDVILTGTPAGVGFFHDPKVFLADGDLVEVAISGIGNLRSTCRTVALAKASGP